MSSPHRIRPSPPVPLQRTEAISAASAAASQRPPSPLCLPGRRHDHGRCRLESGHVPDQQRRRCATNAHTALAYATTATLRGCCHRAVREESGRSQGRGSTRVHGSRPWVRDTSPRCTSPFGRSSAQLITPTRRCILTPPDRHKHVRATCLARVRTARRRRGDCRRAGWRRPRRAGGLCPELLMTWWF